jgi:signal transduction histidine kinase
MALLLQELRSRLQYKIILPFLLLTLLVALAGSAIVFSLVAGSLQERFNNQLATVTRAASDSMVTQEQANLQFLREVAFVGPNTSTGAPGVAEALANNNVAGLREVLALYYEAGIRRSSVRLDRLIAFDRSGRSVVDYERPLNGGDQFIDNPGIDLNAAPFTNKILTATSDDRGDKYGGLIRFADTGDLFFATIAPVRQGDQVVGGLIVAMRVDSLLSTTIGRSQAGAITLYDSQGKLLASTLGDETLVPDMSGELYQRFVDNPDPFTQAVYNVEQVAGREFQFAYVPLNIRGVSVGILAPALSRDYVVGTWSNARSPIIALILVLMLLIIVLGVFIARQITRPLEELVATARAVTNGDLERRAHVFGNDEIGLLSKSFNTMTEYLLQLYGQVHAESSQRAAIVESITDGIIVCDEKGVIQLVNRATRALLELEEHEPHPQRLSDIPLKELTEGVMGFGSQRASDLYTLDEKIVRVSIAPVVTEDRTRLGYVCVLQDMTAEVAVDRAKTNFIGTISHELRTPLTVIRGNSDLLMRGLAGPLDEDQKVFVESIRQHATNMTSLITNVITIAGLDSGSLPTNLELIDLQRPIEEAAWPQRSMIKGKNLTLTIEVAGDIPPVLADFDQVRMIMHQLIDNARRYTAEGTITVRACDKGDYALIEVEDTGRGIAVDQQAHVFDRFTRGDGTSEGINSSERGIGLGLAIVKQLVERQGGTIWLKSEPGQGSTFSFTLRYANDPTTLPENTKPSLAAAA